MILSSLSDETLMPTPYIFLFILRVRQLVRPHLLSLLHPLHLPQSTEPYSHLIWLSAALSELPLIASLTAAHGDLGLRVCLFIF